MAQRDVVILSGVRTAIGDYGGSLKDFPPSELGAKVIREAVARAKIDPASVGQVVLGNVIHTEPRDMYISRVAAVNGGAAPRTGAAAGEWAGRRRRPGPRAGGAGPP